MIFIPGWIVSTLTFPGVVIHEMAHRFFCDIHLVKVYKIVYFTVSNESFNGCVIHEKTDSLYKSFFISFGPLFLNTIFCVIFTLPYSAGDYLVNDMVFFSNVSFIKFLFYFFFWIGISAGMHALPSKQDISSFTTLLNEKKSFRFLIVRCLLYPLIGIILFLDMLSIFGIKLLVGAYMSQLVPWLIFG